MKNVTAFVFVALLIVLGCNSQQNAEVSAAEDLVFEVPELLSVAMDSLDKEIQVTGLVTHVCSHSGRRCFLEDTTGEHSIKIEATDAIGQFSRDLMGQTITVTGIVKENRLSTEYIDEWEVEVKEKSVEEAEDGGESCASELANINSMRDWMKEHNTDYYSIFYIDGTSYSVNNAEESL